MIFLYHKISKVHKTCWYVTTPVFRRHLRTIRDMGKIVVPLSAYNPEDSRHVVITFDGGYEEMMTEAVPTLKEFGYPFEIFVIGNYIGRDNSFDAVEPLENFLNEGQLRTVVESGGHLQWHTNSHPTLKDIPSREAWIEELEIPPAVQALDPNGFTFFAYPYGGNAQWQYDEVAKRFKGALFVGGGSDTDIYRLNRTMVFEGTDIKFVLSSPLRQVMIRAARCLRDGRIFSAIRNRVGKVVVRCT